MPTFVVYTNLPTIPDADQFLRDASKFVADRLAKPEKFVTVRVHPNQLMSHGGSTDPCGSVELYSINLGTDKNNEHTKAIGDFIADKLTIPRDRFYVNFNSLERIDVGIDGKTFA
ncbi:macrophage migration inhibitory factor-like [Ylistrum balloti]|uniref:macrophage migration inhibitory factor-like n=1 Tax=Ylistrum balloti TaxID=509963 RepID=UPI002905945C|nr:macrophage migration inhibitory factor-like [Ylistrum balloti]